MKTHLLFLVIAFAGCAVHEDLGDDVSVTLDDKADGSSHKVDALATYSAARARAAATLDHPVAARLDGVRVTPHAKMYWSWHFIDGHHYADIAVSSGPPWILETGAQKGGLSKAFDPSKVAIGGSKATTMAKKTLPGTVTWLGLAKRADQRVRWVAKDESSDLASIDGDTGDVVDGDGNGDGIANDSGDGGYGGGDTGGGDVGGGDVGGGDVGDGGDGGGELGAGDSTGGGGDDSGDGYADGGGDGGGDGGDGGGDGGGGDGGGGGGGGGD